MVGRTAIARVTLSLILLVAPAALGAAPSEGAVLRPPEKPADRLPWIQEAGIRMGGTRGIGPGTALGAAAFWGMGHAPLPLLRVAASFYDYQSLSTGTDAPTAHFSLFAAEPQICKSITLARGMTFSGTGCAGVELGWYTAKGVIPTGAPFTTHNYGHSWASVLLSVPLRFERSGIFFELAPEIRAPLVSGSFEFRIPSSQPVFSIPRLAFGGVIASGLTFR